MLNFTVRAWLDAGEAPILDRYVVISSHFFAPRPPRIENLQAGYFETHDGPPPFTDVTRQDARRNLNATPVVPRSELFGALLFHVRAALSAVHVIKHTASLRTSRSA